MKLRSAARVCRFAAFLLGRQGVQPENPKFSLKISPAAAAKPSPRPSAGSDVQGRELGLLLAPLCQQRALPHAGEASAL